MPITEILADSWSVEHDVSSPLTARRFDVSFTKVLPARTWDSTLYDTLKVYRGEADPDLVRIKGQWDGEEREIILGVVDEIGRSQSDDGVGGTLRGRDRMALVLDGYPTTAFTIQGISVASDGVTIVPGQRYREAVAQIAALAGLSVLWDVGTDDYVVGRSLVVTTDTTYGEAIAQLLEPWRLSDRHAHDAWIESSTLRVRRRLPAGSGEITINYERLIVDEFTRSALQTISDVQVIGADYTAIISDPINTEGCSAVRTTSVSNVIPDSRDENDVVVAGSGAKMSYTENTTEQHDAECRLFAVQRTRWYHDLRRQEMWTKGFTFYSLPGDPRDKSLESEVEEHRVTDTRDGAADVPKRLLTNALTSRKVTVWTYYADNGDPLTEDVFESEFGSERDTNADGKIDTLRMSTNRATTYRYHRTHGYVYRTWAINEQGTTGDASRQFGSSELGSLKLGQKPGSAVPFGKKQETRRISCGADAARRKETNDLIGDAAAACLIRDRILEDHAFYKGQIRIRMTPDHRVLVGRRVTIAGAPSWWDVTTFTVLSSHIRTRDDESEQEITGLAWITPPA